MAGQLGGAEQAHAGRAADRVDVAAQKNEVREEVAAGEAGIVIGTHALLQDAVEFHRLGMVVVDEQHRFGVEQRDRLRAKAPEGVTPHLLVMTATPIPRTVALTHFGDLETSTLRELPRGRQPITTNTIFLKGTRPGSTVRGNGSPRKCQAGRQAYVVAPASTKTTRAAKGEEEGDQVEQGPPDHRRSNCSSGYVADLWRACGSDSCTVGFPPTKRTP